MEPIEAIVTEVLRRLAEEKSSFVAPSEGIPAEMSARHIHLSPADLKALFDLEELPVSRTISQPGQYLSTLRVKLIGPKGCIENVAVLGPVRKATQVEISSTDSRALGILAPLRLSGDLNGAAPVYIQAGEHILRSAAAIVAKRHLHMLPTDASRFGVEHGQSVCVRLLGSRPLILEDVSVRVSEQSALALHVDTDEANAAGLDKNSLCEIVSREACLGCASKSLKSTAGAPSSPHALNSPAAASASCSAQEHAVAVSCSDERSCSEKLLTETLVRELAKGGAKRLCLSKGQLITPLARDTAKQLGLEIVVSQS